MDKEYLDPKQKLIKRIEKEKLWYRENFSLSLRSGYEYCSQLSLNEKHKATNVGLFIYGPKFTDYTELEQAYCMAHELGHHYINEKMSSFLLKVSRCKLPIVVEITEYLAWKEAKNICLEENIKVGYEFHFLRDRCLKTYTSELKKSVRSMVDFGIHIFSSYYMILFTVYLMNNCSKNNVIDLFGIINYFSDINVMQVAKGMWLMYTVYHILKIFIKGIKKFKKSHEKWN